MSLPLERSYAPMEAETASELPNGGVWQYEPKWDGFRALAFRDGDTVRLQSKAGKPLARYFPDVAESLERLAAGRFVLDGEIVIPVEGRLSFPRVHRARAGRPEPVEHRALGRVGAAPAQAGCRSGIRPRFKREIPPRHEIPPLAAGQGAATVHHGADRMKKTEKPKSTARSAGRLGEYRQKRDFTRTAEPRGGRRKAARKLQYVIQKHAASRLHYDLRLELDGVMKSWAVPKGPSLDPSVKRLAMEVEDHPIEYNAFEGTIPKGEYGGGTVMVWDRGTYTYGGADDGDPVEALRRGYEKGDFKVELHGKRLQGSWVLVRTRRGDPKHPQWLLIKHRDDAAAPGSEVVEEYLTSAATGRTMDEIAAGRKPRARRGTRS